MAMRYRHLKQCQFNKDAVAVYRCVFYQAISLRASFPFMASEEIRERTRECSSHSRLLSRAALARLLAAPLNGELALP